MGGLVTRDFRGVSVGSLVGLLASPQGIFWDLHLFIVAVWLIPRLVEWRQNKRWLPAKQLFYRRLFINADALLHNVVPRSLRVRGSGTKVTYRFGQSYTISVGGAFEKDFGAVLSKTQTPTFKGPAS
jgi:hypothetical protein